jgi:sporulation protein YlmC with PRC-barrel domain
MDIPMKAKVQCVDGPAGQSTQVIINPTNKKITHVVVKERQSPHAERLVPIRYLTEATGDVIRLRCSRRELSEMQPLVLTEFVRSQMPSMDDRSFEYMRPSYLIPEWMEAKHKSIPRGELGVRRGAKVKASDGTVGRVDEFVIDPGNGGITHVVLRDGHLWDREEVTIPVTEIERIEERTVHLALDKKTVKALPAIPVRRKWL